MLPPRNGELDIKNGDLAIENGDLTLENGDLTRKIVNLNGENGDLTRGNWDVGWFTDGFDIPKNYELAILDRRGKGEIHWIY